MGVLVRLSVHIYTNTGFGYYKVAAKISLAIFVLRNSSATLGVPFSFVVAEISPRVTRLEKIN